VGHIFAKAVIAAVTAAQVATIDRIAVIVFMSAFPIIRRYGDERPLLAGARPGSTAHSNTAWFDLRHFVALEIQLLSKSL